MTELKGKIKVISFNTAGIILQDREGWINPTPECKKDILNRQEEVKKIGNKEVILNLDDKGNYNSIEVVKQSEEVEVEESKVEEPEKKTDWDAVERRKYRAMSISYAKDLVTSGKLDISKLKDEAKTIYEFIQEKDE